MIFSIRCLLDSWLRVVVVLVRLIGCCSVKIVLFVVNVSCLVCVVRKVR